MGWGGGNSKDKPKPTDQERALADVAARDWDRYKASYVPAENQYVSRLRATPGDFAAARGAAIADVEQATAGAASRIIGAGDISSGRSQMALADLYATKGTARGAAVNQAQLARENVELRGLSKMAAFGRGLADQSRVGLASTAAEANQKNIDELRNKISEQNALLEGASGLAGAYAGYKGWLNGEKK